MWHDVRCLDVIMPSDETIGKEPEPDTGTSGVYPLVIEWQVARKALAAVVELWGGSVIGLEDGLVPFANGLHFAISTVGRRDRSFSTCGLSAASGVGQGKRTMWLRTLAKQPRARI